MIIPTCKYWIQVFLICVVLVSCKNHQKVNSDLQQGINLKPDTIKVDTAKLKVVRVNKENVITRIPGKNGMLSPTVIKAGKPKVSPYRLHDLPVIKPVRTKATAVRERLKKRLQTKQTPEIIHFPDSGYVLDGTDTIFAPEIKRAIRPKPVKAFPFATKDAMVYDIRFLNVDQKLPASYIYSVCDDENGNLWFATYLGVTCFDGESFYTFTEKEGLLVNYTTSVFHDSKGNMWFGSLRGISKYDGKHFTTYTSKQGLVSNRIWTINEDKHGNIWIGTSNGLSKFNGKSFTNYTTESGLANNTIWDLQFDDQGQLWMGTNGGFSYFDGDVIINYTEKEGFKNKSVSGIEFSGDGDIWLTTDDGLCRFDGEYFTTYNHGLSKGINAASAILLDKNGQLWVGTSIDGIYKVDIEKLKNEQDGAWIHYSKTEGLSVNKIYCLFEDDNGNIWAGTFGGGINCIKPNSFISITNTEGFSGYSSTDVYQDSHRNLWFGTNDNGVCRFDGVNFYAYTIPEGLIRNGITTIVEDSIGNMWFGTDVGISKFNGVEFINYTTKQGLAGDYIYSSFVDTKNNLWFYTRSGISVYNGESFTNFYENSGLGSERIVCGLEVKNGYYWLGTDKGLCRFDGENFIMYTTENGLPHNYVNSIMEANNGDIWLGTDGGLSIFNGEVFTNFDVNDGLTNNLVWSTIQDSLGNVWISTENGLNYAIMGKRGIGETKRIERIESFTTKDGIKAASFKPRATCIDTKNRIWWSNNAGLVMLDLNNFSLNESSPNSQINSIEINEQFIDFNLLQDTLNGIAIKKHPAYKKMRFSNIRKFKNYPEDLVLPNNLNTVTFRYSAIDWNAPQKLQYTYQLVGIDKKWNKLTPESKATYRNLPHGNYSFKVKAIGGAKKWSNTSTVQLIILPPWWQSWWIYVVYVFASIGIMVLIIQWRLKRIRKQKRFLQKIVKERTYEVLQQKEALVVQAETLKKQNEKLQQLDEFKQGMTSMIVHDLKNPLNAIINTSNTFSVEKQLNNIKLAGRQMLNMVLNILDVHKYEETQMKIEKKSCSLLAISQDALDEVSFLAKQKNIVLLNKIEKDIVVAGDEEIIKRIFINILTNAIKYTPNNGTVTLINERLSGLVKVSITDTGEGIPPEKAHLVFTKFGQVIAKKSGSVRSTGLGLTFCKMAVEAHGGEIGVDSELTKGTTFWFTIQLIEQSENVEKITSFHPQTQDTLLTLIEKEKLSPFAIQMKKTEIYKMFELRKILRQINDAEHEGIKFWKEEITEVIRSGNSKKYTELLNIVLTNEDTEL